MCDAYLHILVDPWSQDPETKVLSCGYPMKLASRGLLKFRTKVTQLTFLALP